MVKECKRGKNALVGRQGKHATTTETNYLWTMMIQATTTNMNHQDKQSNTAKTQRRCDSTLLSPPIWMEPKRHRMIFRALGSSESLVTRPKFGAPAKFHGSRCFKKKFQEVTNVLQDSNVFYIGWYTFAGQMNARSQKPNKNPWSQPLTVPIAWFLIPLVPVDDTRPTHLKWDPPKQWIQTYCFMINYRLHICTLWGPRDTNWLLYSVRWFITWGNISYNIG